MDQPFTAIDLYSGVGGWSLGLRMAGIDVIRSYDCWDAANETNLKNNKHPVRTCDVRKLAASEIPASSIIVGSPPCTQFSFSNRGGSGDISDGLDDLVAFLSVVQQKRPRWWVMENVPRVAAIVNRELLPGGRLHSFRALGFEARIFDMAEFGLPQRRRRCLVGNINFGLLANYSESLARRTLRGVLQAFSDNSIVDPIYGLDLPRSEVTDHIYEQCLNLEEERVNKAAKVLHPIYNDMCFPDRPDRPIRTVTATCTRVSRESIVIEAPERPGAYRRLTIRERAIAQGFPITFQFFGQTHAQKLRMVGNAVPPLFAFYVGHAIRGTPAAALPAPAAAVQGLESCSIRAPLTIPEAPSFKYPANRRFRFAIPSLRLKSGMRFELTNGQVGNAIDWHVQFVFGTSKAIKQLRPEKLLFMSLMDDVPADVRTLVLSELASFEEYIRSVDVKHLQSVWSHTGPGSTRPLILLDEISRAGGRLTNVIEPFRPIAEQCLRSTFELAIASKLTRAHKIVAHAPRILSGLFVAAVANSALSVGPTPRLGSITAASRGRISA